MIEICALGEVDLGLERARRHLLPALAAHPGLAALSNVAMGLHPIAFAFWFAGDEASYRGLADLWNAQLLAPCPGGGGGGGEKPFPAFSMYDPDAQCDHFRCRNVMIPKMRLAMEMMPPAAGRCRHPAPAADLEDAATC
mmetsp:Transcript_41034/g.72852  ORF Transcript_41034/g.72852 Transcript_41034/m.72852 type:complete len:139 (-) Transcript_41034:158-574(-)